MAGKQGRRDYRAEEARRNARARELGYSSRAAMRRALRQGQPVVRDRRGTIVGKAQGPTRPEWAKAGYSSEGVFRAERKASSVWSQKHSRKETSRYKPTLTPAESHAYYNAFVNPETKASRVENELYSLREYLVDTMGYYTDEEFDERY